MADRRYKLIGQGLPGSANFGTKDLIQDDQIKWNDAEQKWEISSGGGSGGVGLDYGRWDYEAATTAPPGNQALRFNNATIASATQLFWDYDNKVGSDLSALILNIAIGSNIYIQAPADATKAVFFKVTAITDNTTYATLNISDVNVGTTALVNLDEVGVLISGGAVTWGSIEGTLSDQTDLQTVLNTKLEVADLSNYTQRTANEVISGLWTINNDLLMANLLGDRIALWGGLDVVGTFGLGVESGTLYSKAPTYHRWYLGANADGGGSDALELGTVGLTVRDKLSVDRPSDFWTTAQGAYIGLGTVGSIGTNGSNGVDIVANGYRNNAAGWTSLNSGGLTGGAKIALRPDGDMRFYGSSTAPTGTEPAQWMFYDCSQDRLYTYVSYIEMQNKDTFRSTDGWLRLNSSGDYTNGVYTPGIIRADGGFRTDASGYGVDTGGVRGITAVTGSYGSVQTFGTGAGSYSGYSIGGRAVFMNNASTTTGIYNDTNNQWFARFIENSDFYLYRAGVQYMYSGANQVILADGVRHVVSHTTSTQNMATATGGHGMVEIQSFDSSGDAFMTFHRVSGYATYFGLTAQNQFAYGGWSAGAAHFTFATHKSSTYNSCRITFSSSAPSGGADGDIWFEY